MTVAAVIEHQGRYLLVEEHTPEGPRLNQPAGHLELAESPIEACIREVREETARLFTPHHFLGVYLGRFQRRGVVSVDTGNRSASIANNNFRNQEDTYEDITYVRLAFSGSVGEEILGASYDTEIIRTVWMSLDELRAVPEAHRSPMVMLCIKDYLEGRRLPLEAVRTHESVFA